MHLFQGLPVAFLALGSGAAFGQTSSSHYVRLPEADEIALARSAAPDAVSADAAVWVLRDGRYEIAAQGTNGNECFVARSEPRSLEPVCYDPEGAATILRWEFEYFALRTAGKSPEAREAALAEAVGSGRIRLPSRPAMSYMMSSGQHLFDPESGSDAGHWRPHVMLYVPYLTNEAIGLTGMTGEMFVERPGTPMAHLIVVVPAFIDPKGTKTP
ncbi:MAG TPA: hypothetical protein VGA37_05210 [Gemmatimonadales bacterium]